MALPPRPSRKLSVEQSGRIKVTELSDEELIDRKLRVTDPTAEPNMSTEPPAEDAVLTFETSYQSDTDALCVYGHKHKKGIIVRDENGVGYAVGHDCGKKKFGFEWTLMENERTRLEDRQYYLRRFREIANAVTKEADWIDQLPSHPALQAYDALRPAFRTFSPELYDICSRAVERTGGKLYAMSDERDYAAEQRRKEDEHEITLKWNALQTERERKEFVRTHGTRCLITKNDPLYKQVPREVGQLRCTEIFERSTPMKVRVKEYAGQLKQLTVLATNPSAFGNMGQAAKLGQHIVENIENCFKQIEDALAFFSFEELDAFTKWANLQPLPGMEFSVVSGGLEVFDTGEQETRVFLMRPELKAISLEPLKRIRASFSTQTAPSNDNTAKSGE